VAPGAGLDTAEKKKNLLPCRESNPGRQDAARPYAKQTRLTAKKVNIFKCVNFSAGLFIDAVTSVVRLYSVELKMMWMEQVSA
jgi:hypothetical protein